MRRFSVARATEASRRGSVLFGRSSVSDGAAADGSPPPRRPSRGRRFSTALSTIFSKGPDASAEKYAAGGSGDDGESTRRSNRKSVTVTVPEETPSRAGTFTSEEAVGSAARFKLIARHGRATQEVFLTGRVSREEIEAALGGDGRS